MSELTELEVIIPDIEESKRKLNESLVAIYKMLDLFEDNPSGIQTVIARVKDEVIILARGEASDYLNCFLESYRDFIYHRLRYNGFYKYKIPIEHIPVIANILSGKRVV